MPLTLGADVAGSARDKEPGRREAGDRDRPFELTPETDADMVIEAIVNAARTGSGGDGRIWVTEAVRVVRVRTGEPDFDAV